MGKIFKDEIRLPEFERDFKQLVKKYKSLPEDLDVLISTSLNLFHKLDQRHNGIEHMAGFGIAYPEIYKVRKFACKSLKGRGAMSGIRVIYAYYPDLDKVEFVEIYFKADQENEDRTRVLRLYKRS